MSESYDFGMQAEGIATAFLQKKGYEILARNYRYRRAEIDIIAKKNDTIAIIEVKARSYTHYGEPESFVTKNKIRFLTEAANHFITENQLTQEVRFDVIPIKKKGEELSIKHIENAFYPL